MVGDHAAWIIDGPTDELEPPFDWNNWPKLQANRQGMPTVWNFSWTLYHPDQNFSRIDDWHVLEKEGSEIIRE